MALSVGSTWEPRTQQQKGSHGMGHSLIAPLFGQPVDLDDRRVDEPRRRQMRSATVVDSAVDRDAFAFSEPYRHRSRFDERTVESGFDTPHVFPDYLFRINADNTIVDVLRGASISLALPSYAFDGKSADAGFAEKFW